MPKIFSSAFGDSMRGLQAFTKARLWSTLLQHGQGDAWCTPTSRCSGTGMDKGPAHQYLQDLKRLSISYPVLLAWQALTPAWLWFYARCPLHRRRPVADQTSLHAYASDRQDLPMKRKTLLIAVACVSVLGGCTSTALRNAANTECERRVHSDRERCLRNNRSSDEALAARNASDRDSRASWTAQTLDRIEQAGK